MRPTGKRPGPATLAMSSPGQASKYMDYWKENKGQCSKQTCDKFSWYLLFRFRHTTVTVGLSSVCYLSVHFYLHFSFTVTQEPHERA